MATNTATSMATNTATSDAATNPLFGLQVGSYVKDTGQFIIDSLIKGSITITDTQTEQWKSMSGQSSYTYTKEMNQGSFGLSGSYGFSGLSKVDAALAAYVGSSSATGGKSVKLNYQVKVLGGIQYIDFENLTVATLAAALKDTPRHMLTTALEKYNALNAALELLAPSGKTLLDVLGDPTTYAKESVLCKDWYQAVTDFNSSYGDGVVIAVAWGGIGTVTLEIDSNSDDSSWKYGGEASFSYAGPSASVAVGAAYDGNQSQGTATVKVHCYGFCSGACVQAQTDAWLTQLNGQAFSALADVDVLASAPNMTAAAQPPTVPPFIKPKPDPTLESKLTQIKDLKGLALYAKACAYDKAKAAAEAAGADPPALSDFLKDAEDRADVAKLEDMSKGVAANDVDARGDDDDDDVIAGHQAHLRVPLARAHAARTAHPSGAATTPPPAGATRDFSGNVPLGVWITNWAHLFPWLATGYLNSITNIEAAASSIRYRVLMQDFLALSKLYYIADNCKFAFPDVKKINLQKIADNFAQACANLQPDDQKKPIDYEKAIQSALQILAPDAAKIHKIWNDNSFLRSCELGLAVLDRDGYSPQIAVDKNGVCAGSKCSFDPVKRSPWSEFKNCYKVLPLILPDGTIFAIGPGNTLLVDWDDKTSNFTFSNDPGGNPMNFQPDAEKALASTIWSGDEFSAPVIKLYPVPFSAANGIDWKGQAFSVNVAADDSLKSQLDQITDTLTARV